MVASACTALPGVWYRMRCAGNPGMCEFTFAVEAPCRSAGRKAQVCRLTILGLIFVRQLDDERMR